MVLAFTHGDPSHDVSGIVALSDILGTPPSGDDLEHKSCLKANVYVSLCHFSKQICKNSPLGYGCTVYANGWIGWDQVDEKSH